MNAHPIELRRRIFNYHLSHSVRNTAKIFGVSPDTVQRLKQLSIETDDLAPRPCHAEHAHAISPEGELYVQQVARMKHSGIRDDRGTVPRIPLRFIQATSLGHGAVA